jgi:site-specific DNA recombinase
MEKQKCLIYCRVSSDKQVKEGHGLESQEQRCTQHALAQGYEVTKVFRDEGISGSILERPAMRSLLQYLDDNLINNYIIVFDDMSRLARDVSVHIQLKLEITSRKSVIDCVNQKIEDTPQGEFMEMLMASYAQMDRKVNAKRVSQRMKARIERGYWCFCPPTGMAYKNTAEHGKLLSPKEPAASIIKEALEGYANGRFAGQTDVQKFLQTKSHLLNSPKIHLGFVKRILTKVLYTGYIEYPKWDIALRKGHHEGFVSLATFDAVKEKLTKPEKKIHVTDTVQFPLRRLVVCRVCGHKMTGSRNKGKTKYYNNYTCNNRLCTAKPKNIQKHILETAYMNMLKGIAPEKDLIEFNKRIALDVWDRSMKAQGSHQKARQALIKQKEGEVNQCLDLILKTTNDTARQQYELRIEELTEETGKLKRARPVKEGLHFNQALEEVLDFIGTPCKYWEQANIEGKHLIHRLVFPQQLLYDVQEGFGTPVLSLPFTTNKHLMSNEKALVEMPGVEPGSKDRNRKRLQS